MENRKDQYQKRKCTTIILKIECESCSVTINISYNLIFGGIEQTQEYEEVLVNFMRTELGIDDANSINLQNVHRLSRRNEGKPRNIISRFANHSDDDGVLKEVTKALKKQTTIFSQPRVSDRNWRSS